MYLSPSVIIDAATATFTAPELTRAAALSSFEAFVSQGETPLQRWSSTIGIVTAIVGNILISFALNIQRYAHIQLHKERQLRREKSRHALKHSQSDYGTTTANGRGTEVVSSLEDSFTSEESRDESCQEVDLEEESTYLRSPYWWGGIVLMTIGEAGNFLAYGFAPASIVSPLGVVALVANCVIAPFMLKERFRLRDFWGVVVAVAGAVTVVLSAKQEEKKLGPHEILLYVTRTEFEVYMGTTVFLIVTLAWASPRYGQNTILIDLGLVGLFGAYTALSTKGVASMLSSTLWRAFTTPVTYVLLAILFGTAVMQVKYVNKALQRFDSTQVIPVQFVMFTLSVIIGSAILYRDFEKATVGTMTKFIWGCLLTFLGVYLITSGRDRNRGDEDPETDEEGEERISLSTHDHDVNVRHPLTAPRKHGRVHATGDATNDEGIPSASRRSSRVSVSFAEPNRPRTPRMYSNSSFRGSRNSADLSSRSEETPLLVNPWKNSADDLLTVARHPGMQTTNSSPQLPSETPAPETPRPPTNRSSTHENMHTHSNLLEEPVRPYTPARNSISRMMPAPFLSPLSGGLSVIVADSLRRGIETPIRHRPLKRLRKSKSRPSRSSNPSEETLSTSVGDRESGTDAEFSRSLEPERSSWSGITRARSLSNTLGDFLRGKRQKTEVSSNMGEDDEAGPSGM